MNVEGVEEPLNWKQFVAQQLLSATNIMCLFGHLYRFLSYTRFKFHFSNGISEQNEMPRIKSSMVWIPRE